MLYLPLSFSFFIFLILHNFIILLPQFFLFPFFPPPPPPHFYCFPSTTATFLLFSLHHQHHHQITRKPKPTKNSTRPYLNEIPAHFIHEIKTKGYDVIGVNVFLRTLMRILRKKEVNSVPPILLIVLLFRTLLFSLFFALTEKRYLVLCGLGMS